MEIFVFGRLTTWIFILAKEQVTAFREKHFIARFFLLDRFSFLPTSYITKRYTIVFKIHTKKRGKTPNDVRRRKLVINQPPIRVPFKRGENMFVIVSGAPRSHDGVMFLKMTNGENVGRNLGFDSVQSGLHLSQLRGWIERCKPIVIDFQMPDKGGKPSWKDFIGEIETVLGRDFE